MIKSSFRGITFADTDIINVEEWIPSGENNPHNIRPFLLHDHGSALCVVFADNLEDALDAAVDANKLDSFLIRNGELEDYLVGTEYQGITYLGNAGDAFDIEELGIEEMPNPQRSFCAQWNACQ